MAISRISSGNNGTFGGSYTTNDLLVIHAFDATSATLPSTPSGYTQLTSAQQSASSIAMAVFYKFATSGSETYPTITNSTASVYAIYRGVDTTTPFSGTGGQLSSGSSSTISYSGIVSFSNPGSDWVLTFGNANSSSAAVGSHPPTSMTLPTSAEVTGTGYDIALFDSNGPLSSYSFNSKTLSAAAVWMTKTTELHAKATSTVNSGFFAFM